METKSGTPLKLLLLPLPTLYSRRSTRELAIVYLDMSKAFDSINHSIFPKISSALQNDAALSDALPVVCQVRQGSVLGALLFSIYVNDLPTVSETCSGACYVDDTKLILSFTGEESHAAADKINDDLQRIR